MEIILNYTLFFTTFVKNSPMKFDITQQRAFSTLVTIIIMSILGVMALLRIEAAASNIIVSDSLLGGFISEFQHSHTPLSAIVAAVAILYSSIWLGHIVSQLNLFGLNTSIQLYVISALFWCIIYGDDFLLSTAVATLMTQATGYLLRAVRSNNNLSHIFNAALSLSIIPTLYTSSAIVWGILPIMLIIMGVTFREAIITLVGLALPCLAVLYFYWLHGAEFVDTARSIYAIFMEDSNLFEITEIALFKGSTIALALLLSILSIFWLEGNIHRNQVRLIVCAALSMGAMLSLLSPSANMLTLPLLAPPLAILTSYAMASMRGVVANSVYFLLLILLLAELFYPLYIGI